MPPADSATLTARWLRSRRVRVAIASGLLLAAFVAAFDWTWFRPLIQQHIQDRSGRRIDFDELHIGLNRAFQPTVRMRNLVVQNAAWAAPRPLVRAAEFGFTLAWQSLHGDKVVLTRLDVVDAEVDLERQADGLRNWRLTHPDDRGPGRVRVMSIDARNTRARIVDHGIDLELELQVTPLAAPLALPAHPDLPLNKQVALHGTRNGTAFDARASVSDVLTLFDTGAAFALRGELRAGSSRANVEGTLTDLLQLGRLDLDLRVAGPRVADLGRVLGIRVPVPALAADATAHVAKAGERWNVSRLRAKVGRSDLAGEAQLDRKPPENAGEGRSMLRATLTSERIDTGDLRAPKSVASEPGDDAAHVSKLEADIDLKIASVHGLPLGPLTRVSAHASLRDDRWVIDPVALTIAGGRASGKLVVETAGTPIAYALDLRLQGLQFEQLTRAMPQLQAITGALDARVAMRARGDSVASLASAASGSLQAELVRATIPAALDARLGLDGVRLLRAKLGVDDARTPITCSALDLRFEAGRGTVRKLAFDTPYVALGGAGWIDLGRNTLDLLLTPRRKQSALLALDRAVQVSGKLVAPKTALVALDRAHAGTACVAGSMQ